MCLRSSLISEFTVKFFNGLLQVDVAYRTPLRNGHVSHVGQACKQSRNRVVHMILLKTCRRFVASVIRGEGRRLKNRLVSERIALQSD